MSEIKKGDIVGVGPDGILGPYPAGSESWSIVGVAASRSIGDEPVQFLQRGGGPVITLDRDGSVLLDEDEDD